MYLHGRRGKRLRESSPCCDMETRPRCGGEKGTGWWPGSQWEERGIGSLRRRLQKDSRERGSGIFIIGIPVTVSKPFTALISVAELRWKRTREVKERKKEKEKKKRSRGCKLASLAFRRDWLRTRNSYFLALTDRFHRLWNDVFAWTNIC